MKTDLRTMLNRLQEQEQGVKAALTIVNHLKGESSNRKPLKLHLFDKTVLKYPVFDLVTFKTHEGK